MTLIDLMYRVIHLYSIAENGLVLYVPGTSRPGTSMKSTSYTQTHFITPYSMYSDVLQYIHANTL